MIQIRVYVKENGFAFSVIRTKMSFKTTKMTELIKIKTLSWKG